MIEDRSYGKAELAMLYFPTATPRVALNRLVRWINRCPELKQSLCSGYAGQFSHFYTRQQVAEIIKFLDWGQVRHSYQSPGYYCITIKTDEENVLTGFHIVSHKAIRYAKVY